MDALDSYHAEVEKLNQLERELQAEIDRYTAQGEALDTAVRQCLENYEAQQKMLAACINALELAYAACPTPSDDPAPLPQPVGEAVAKAVEPLKAAPLPDVVRDAVAATEGNAKHWSRSDVLSLIAIIVTVFFSVVGIVQGCTNKSAESNQQIVDLLEDQNDLLQSIYDRLAEFPDLIAQQEEEHPESENLNEVSSSQ